MAAETYLALVGAEAEVLESLTAVLGATEDKGVATSRGTESKLIQSNGLTTSGDNARAGGSGEAESGNSHLGHGEQAVVISDGADNNHGALLALLVEVGNNAGQGDGRPVGLRHKKTAKHNLVEGGVGTTYVLSVFGRELSGFGAETYGQGSGKALPRA